MQKMLRRVKMVWGCLEIVAIKAQLIPDTASGSLFEAQAFT